MDSILIEQVAAAALAGESLLTRHLALTFLRETDCLSDIPQPTVKEPHVLALSAAFVELFAQRRGEQSPAWTEKIKRYEANETLPYDEPIFLFRCKPESNTYRLCLETAPNPLRKRGFFAPYNYLTFV